MEEGRVDPGQQERVQKAGHREDLTAHDNQVSDHRPNQRVGFRFT